MQLFRELAFDSLWTVYRVTRNLAEVPWAAYSGLIDLSEQIYALAAKVEPFDGAIDFQDQDDHVHIRCNNECSEMHTFDPGCVLYVDPKTAAYREYAKAVVTPNEVRRDEGGNGATGMMSPTGPVPPTPEPTVRRGWPHEDFSHPVGGGWGAGQEITSERPVSSDQYPLSSDDSLGAIYLGPLAGSDQWTGYVESFGPSDRSASNVDVNESNVDVNESNGKPAKPSG